MLCKCERIFNAMCSGIAYSYEQITNLLAPPACGACGVAIDTRAFVVCQRCRDKIQPVFSYDMELTKTKSMRVLAVGAYTFPLKPLILAKTHSNLVKTHQLAQLMLQIIPLDRIQFDYVVAVPLHWTRYAWRGYNQAQELAREIACAQNKPLLEAVNRIERTQLQSKFDRAGRQKNIQDAFVLHTQQADVICGKHVLLVDDLMTTGATLKEVAKTLLKAHPASITAVVASRVV